jgi:hypothetical protein
MNINPLQSAINAQRRNVENSQIWQAATPNGLLVSSSSVNYGRKLAVNCSMTGKISSLQMTLSTVLMLSHYTPKFQVLAHFEAVICVWPQPFQSRKEFDNEYAKDAA